MVTAVTTSTASAATRAFNGRHLDRNQDGTLWSQHLDGATASTKFFYSKDSGATWISGASDIAGTSGSESLFIDLDDYAHFVFKASNASGGRTTGHLYYMRGTPNVGRTAWTWSAAVSISGANTAYDHPDVVACRNTATGGWDAFIVAGFFGTSTNYTGFARLPITSAGALGTLSYDNLARINGTGMGALGGDYSTTASTYPSIDFNHTGDGKTVAGGTPHLYVGWTAGATGAGKGVRFRKAVYSGGAWTWNAEREIDSTQYVANGGYWLTTHFDGSRAVLTGYLRAAGADNLLLYDRDAVDPASGGTTVRSLLANPQSVDFLLYGSATYDTAGNVYLFGAAGGSTGQKALRYRKWTRATLTLSATTTVDATTEVPYVSAKRGSQPGNSIEIVYTDGTSSPYTVQYDRTVPDVDAPTTPYTPMVLL